MGVGVGCMKWIGSLVGSVALCSKNRVLCFRVSLVKQGYYAQNYARLNCSQSPGPAGSSAIRGGSG